MEDAIRRRRIAAALVAVVSVIQHLQLSIAYAFLSLRSVTGLGYGVLGADPESFTLWLILVDLMWDPGPGGRYRMYTLPRCEGFYDKVRSYLDFPDWRFRKFFRIGRDRCETLIYRLEDYLAGTGSNFKKPTPVDKKVTTSSV